jgi:type I restriction enzyme S subunit
MMRAATLAEVSEFVLDGTHGSPERTETGVPVLSALNVKDGRLSYETNRFTSDQEFKTFDRRIGLAEGDLLLTIVGTIGRAAIVDEVRPAVFQRSVAIIRPNKSKVDSRYLFHVTQSAAFANQLDRATNKSAQAGVYLGKLKETAMPLPPLEEQKRIAAILDQADELRRKRQRALDRLNQLGQAIFIEMFGDPSTNPMGWPKVSLAEAVTTGTIVTYGIVQAGEEYPGGTPYIRTGDIKDGEIRLEGLRHTDPAIAARFQRSRVRSGEIVMSIRATVGTVAFVPDELDGANLTQGTARISPGPDVSPWYLIQYLRSDTVQGWIEGQVKGATFREITLSRLRELPVIIAPQDLQKRFSELMFRVCAQRALAIQALRTTESAFSALQHRAFRGELTVSCLKEASA